MLIPYLNGTGKKGELSHKAHLNDVNGIKHITDLLASYIQKAGSDREPVVVCIGTDRSTGDCLGPLAGSQLVRLTDNTIKVYGTLDHPVHATNLQLTLTQVNKANPNAFIIAVDACLGHLDSVGCINLAKGALKPGAGVHKSLPAVGEAYLTGIVNVGGFMEYLVLQNTRLSVVMKMAECIAEIISLAYLNSNKVEKIYTTT